MSVVAGGRQVFAGGHGSADLAGRPVVVSLTAATCAAVVVGVAVVAWLRGWWTVRARLHYGIVALAGVAFFAVAWEYCLPTWPLV